MGATSGLFFKHLPVAHIKWTVTDYASNFIGGATFTLDSNAVTIAAIGDNTVLDSDPAPGKFDVSPVRVVLQAVRDHAARELSVPINQITCVANNIKQGPCRTGNFGVNPVYSVYWKVAGAASTLIGPSTFQLASADGLYNFAVVDSSINDFDSVLGKIAVKLVGLLVDLARRSRR